MTLRQELHQVKDLLRLEKMKTRKVKKEEHPKDDQPLLSEEEYHRCRPLLFRVAA